MLSEVTRLAACVIFLRNHAVFVLEKFPGMKIVRHGAAMIGYDRRGTDGGVSDHAARERAALHGFRLKERFHASVGMTK
jgi:hypothetical protein